MIDPDVLHFQIKQARNVLVTLLGAIAEHAKTLPNVADATYLVSKANLSVADAEALLFPDCAWAKIRNLPHDEFMEAVQRG
jgi:hypothetical protein